MDDMNYKPNSFKYKEEQKEEKITETKKVQKVVSGPVKMRKKNRILGLFLAEDIAELKKHIINDVIIPAGKDMFMDAMSTVFYGKPSNKTSASYNNNPASKISYNSFYKNPTKAIPESSKSTYNYNNYAVGTRGEAEAVLDQLNDMISQFGFATVGDFYDMLGVRGNHTDNNYGWDEIITTRPIKVRDGWVLDLPRVKLID